MDLGVGDIFVLNTVIDEVSHPVEEVSAISSTESNYNMIINRIVSNEAKSVQEFIFNLENVSSTWEAGARLSTVPIINSLFVAVCSSRVIESFHSKIFIV
jgi:hypothetical protein